MFDVIVIGAGPAGCHTASLLAQKGFDVHVLEDHQVVGEPVDCSGIIGAEAFEELRVADDLKLDTISDLRFVSPGNLEFKFSPRIPLAYVIDRGAFDRDCADRASSRGVRFHLGTKVLDLDVHDGYVEATVARTGSIINSQLGKRQEGNCGRGKGLISDRSQPNNKELQLTIDPRDLGAGDPLETNDGLPLTVDCGKRSKAGGRRSIDQSRLTIDSDAGRNGARRSTIDNLRLTDNTRVDGSIRHLPLAIRPERIRARMAILAGGPRYKLQRKLGMGEPRELLKTAQVEVSLKGLVSAKIFLGSKVAPGSFGWIAPFRRGCREFARVGVSAKTAAGSFLKKRIVELYSQGLVDSTDLPIRSWVIPISPLKRTYSDRVLAVGDAAGQTKPTTGGGIYYGILSAKAAAKIATEAFEKGDFSASILGKYEKEWRKEIGGEVRRGAFFRRLYERLSDNDIDDLFRVVQSDGILANVSKKARFDRHRDVINFILRHPEMGKIFLRGMFR